MKIIKRTKINLEDINSKIDFQLKINIDKEELLNLVKSLKLDRQVWFFGACYDESKIAELIFNANVCVSPGNVGLTAIHSLSYGTPVITHDSFSHQMPEFEAIIPNLTGNFFEEGNLQSMNEVIEKINN